MDESLRVFVPVVGGLGGPQTVHIFRALEYLPGVKPWAPPMDHDQYHANLVEAVQQCPAEHVAIVAHSFGCQTALEACRKLAEIGVRVDYLALIDPVSHSPFWAPTMAYPLNNAEPRLCNIFRSQFPFLVSRADIVGGPEPVVISGTTHNSICHDGSVISAIAITIRALTVSPSQIDGGPR